jgi:hypothetical protein
MRSFQFSAVFTFAALACVLQAFAADGVQPPSAAIAHEPLPNEATQFIDPVEIRGYSILGCLETLLKRKNIVVTIDQAGLEELSKKKLREIKVYQVEFPLPLAAAVEYLAIQVRGTLRIRGKSFHIVAGEGDVLRFLSPTAKKDPFDFKKQLRIEKSVEAVPACDIIDFFSQKLDTPIMVAPEPFDCSPNNLFHKRKCALPAGTKDLGAWLENLALQTRGRVVIRQEAAILVPAGKAN